MKSFVFRTDDSKTCTKCGRLQLFLCYNRKAFSRDGLRSQCKECQSGDYRKYASSNADKIAAKGAKYRQENSEKVARWSKGRANSKRTKDYSRLYYAANKDRCAAMVRAWRLANPDKTARYRLRYSVRPKDKVSASMRSCIRSEIAKGSKGGRKTFDLLGYSPNDLILHLEKLFRDGMSWGNYGRGGWHIDHIRPLASFSYETPDDDDFKKAWALENLQPLWEHENLSKGAKTDWTNKCHRTEA